MALRLPWWLPTYRRPLASLLLFLTLSKLLCKETFIKFTKFRRCFKHPKETSEKMKRTREFLSSMGAYNRFAVEECRQTLSCLAKQGITKVSVYGVNEIAEILYDLSFELPVEVSVIYDECPSRKPWGPPVLPLNAFQPRVEIMIVAAVIGVEEKVAHLSRLGINVEDLVLMGRPPKAVSNSEQSLRPLSDRGNPR